MQRPPGQENRQRRQSADAVRRGLHYPRGGVSLRPPSLCAPQLGASSLPPPACRAEAQEESTQIRQDTMRLIKDFRSSGATQAQQDKLVRDFQSVMKKVVDATKETGKYNVVQLPPPLACLPTG